MSKNLARLFNRSFNVNLILARLCGALWNVHTHCSNGKSFKENYLLGSHYPLLLIQKYHTRWPHAKHKERQVSGSSHRGKWFSKDGLGNPGSPWFPPGDLRGQNYFHKITKTFDLFTLILSQVYGSDFQKTHDMGYGNRLDAQTGKRIQPSLIKLDTKEICSKVKQWHFPLINIVF